MRRIEELTDAHGEPYYRVRYRKDGRQRALTFHGEAAKTDAEEFRALLASLGATRAVEWWNKHLDERESTLTLDQWWDRYLKALTGITDGTRITYARTYVRVWSPALGSKPLAAITREDVARVVNELSRTKADKTVWNAYGIIASCLKRAMLDGHIPATPATDIRLPRRTEHESTEMRFLSHDEWDHLVTFLPAHYLPLFTTLIGTGMRWGEAEALTVGDVSIGDPSLVRITKAAKWDASHSQRTIGPTKTKKSRRSVTLPPEVVAALEPLLDRPKKEQLFKAPKGGPLRHRTVYREWGRATAAAGLDPRPRIHDLRHSHVAWLIKAGIPLAVIQARLGHEDIRTTINVYGHLAPELEVAAAHAAFRVFPTGPRAIES